MEKADDDVRRAGKATAPEPVSGDPGMWSWVLHRISGATIFFFLFVHVLDTALVRVGRRPTTRSSRPTRHPSSA
ncbi:succinate dehydrogenase/Fumarate reductase transmembrane subunit [Mycobacterium xenopi 4042]|uniref:Succinate dehydrogenase/Fumarate reductase transmembrane subunit n=1 Tax=Mycobacterium xenopi 4042 TaxID=1299334 RepID=X7YKI4_MYCXE|nr:succinate dehydrogenase/Fumarate reductase transmembrane subunit [Mycobacterium xenopi 4042]